jgi:hypothetical protein
MGFLSRDFKAFKTKRGRSLAATLRDSGQQSESVASMQQLVDIHLMEGRVAREGQAPQQ